MLALYTYCVYTFNLKWIERRAAISHWHAIQIKFCDHLWLLVTTGYCHEVIFAVGNAPWWPGFCCGEVQTRVDMWTVHRGGWGVGGMAVIKKWPLVKVQLYQYTVTNFGRWYKCTLPMVLFSRFIYKMQLKLHKDHSSREFEAKFTDKMMQHLKDEGPRTIYKPASHAIHKPCQDKN